MLSSMISKHLIFWYHEDQWRVPHWILRTLPATEPIGVGHASLKLLSTIQALRASKIKPTICNCRMQLQVWCSPKTSRTISSADIKFLLIKTSILTSRWEQRINAQGNICSPKWLASITPCKRSKLGSIVSKNLGHHRNVNCNRHWWCLNYDAQPAQ